jgi:hypothetical protein
MLHLLPDCEPETAPQPYAEAVARLASVRHALRLVDPFGGGPAPDLGSDEAVAAAWPEAGEAKQRAFDRRSGQLVAATAAGLEAMLEERRKGREPNAEASRKLVEQIRRELAEVSRVVLG